MSAKTIISTIIEVLIQTREDAVFFSVLMVGMGLCLTVLLVIAVLDIKDLLRGEK